MAVSTVEDTVTLGQQQSKAAIRNQRTEYLTVSCGPEANFNFCSAAAMRDAATYSKFTKPLLDNEFGLTQSGEEMSLRQTHTEVPKSAEINLNHMLLRLSDSQSKLRHESPD